MCACVLPGILDKVNHKFAHVGIPVLREGNHLLLARESDKKVGIDLSDLVEVVQQRRILVDDELLDLRSRDNVIDEVFIRHPTHLLKQRYL